MRAQGVAGPPSPHRQTVPIPTGPTRPPANYCLAQPPTSAHDISFASPLQLSTSPRHASLTALTSPSPPVAPPHSHRDPAHTRPHLAHYPRPRHPSSWPCCAGVQKVPCPDLNRGPLPPLARDRAGVSRREHDTTTPQEHVVGVLGRGDQRDRRGLRRGRTGRVRTRSTRILTGNMGYFWNASCGVVVNWF